MNQVCGINSREPFEAAAALATALGDTMGLVRFYSAVIWLGIALALAGQLKSCTLTMMGLAAKKTQTGIMSYSKFSRMLTSP